MVKKTDVAKPNVKLADWEHISLKTSFKAGPDLFSFLLQGTKTKVSP